MKSRTTRQFRELFARLPAHVQQQAREAYRLFQADPRHPGLHFKKVQDDTLTFSARVGISYRAVAALDGDALVWFWIGSHADYDKLLGLR
ncbi:MAG: type II toxin-antitoxin system RelE family toxin [Pirellulaceae bacterium]